MVGLAGCRERDGARQVPQTGLNFGGPALFEIANLLSIFENLVQHNASPAPREVTDSSNRRPFCIQFNHKN